VHSAVEDVHRRDRQQLGPLSAEVPQRQAGLGCRGAGSGHRHAEQGVGAQPRLVLGAVERDQRFVERPLI